MAHRHKGIFNRFSTFFKILGAILLIVICLSIAYLVTRLGPQKVNIGKALPRQVSIETQEQADKILQQAKEKENASQKANESTKKMALLEQAMALNKKALSLITDTDYAIHDKILDLKKKIENIHALELSLASQEAEKKALSTTKEKTTDTIKNLKTAIEIQKRINNQYRHSTEYDPIRLKRLEREYALLVLQPIYMESVTAEKQARKAQAERKWQAARKAYTKAIQTQKHINMDFRGSKYSSLRRLSKLETDLQTMNSIPYKERIEKLVSAAAQAMKEQHYSKSAQDYKTALRYQKDLNIKFPSSRNVSQKTLHDFEMLSKQADSNVLAQTIIADNKQLDQLLSNREVDKAIEQLQKMHSKVDRYKKQFPDQDSLANEVIQKTEYLYQIQEDIALYQNKIHGQLLPIPKQSDWKMTRTEVAQALYVSILDFNPSRHKGNLYPVESVTWEETKPFCERISWILGRSVRLPKQTEFHQAAGSAKKTNLDLQAWDANNSGGKTHKIATKEANTFGFHDLYGNVAEWLNSESLIESNEAYIAGGDANTSAKTIQESPIDSIKRTYRSRMIGFRIVVHNSLQK